MNSRYILALLVVVGVTTFALFAFEYTQREAIAPEVTTTYTYDADGLPVNVYTLDKEAVIQLAEEQTEPEKKAFYLLRDVELVKRANPDDLESIVAAYKKLYEDESLNAQERALALFKISQQANGHNRFDLLDEFLSPEERNLPAAKKNYLFNKFIYDTYPMGIAYMDIRFHEIVSGEEFNEHEVYMFTIEKLQQDVERYYTLPHLTDLVPDLYMHAAATLSLIDEISIPGSFVTSKEILSLLDRGNASCDSSIHISTRCTTRDFIEITRINYLLKMGETEAAEEKLTEFLASDLRPMIRAYITEYDGLSLGRYPYLEKRTDLVEKLKTTIPTLPDPS
jgi:hypothetical protein